MAHVSRYETRWNQLAARVGEHDATLNSALTAAMAAIQRRNGSLPGGYEGESGKTSTSSRWPVTRS